MSLLQAIFMGLLHGLTEFLPVSSSGHLALGRQLFEIETSGAFFDILLRIGTLAAVVAVYFKDIGKMIAESCGMLRDLFWNILRVFKHKTGDEQEDYRRVVNSSYRKFTLLFLVSAIPVVVIGIVVRELAELTAQILLLPGIFLIVTGVLLFFAGRMVEGERTPKNITYTNSFIVGICQGIAALPGFSHLGIALSACLISGYSRKFAVKYAFLLFIPALLVEIAADIGTGDFAALTGGDVCNAVAAALIAAFVGYICIKLMLVIVKKKKLTIFSIYCLIIGAASIGTYFYLA